MFQQHNAIAVEEEGRIDLALQVYNSGQLQGLRRAAAAFNVKHQRLSDRLRGITTRSQTRPESHKLIATEEQTLFRYILDLDSPGFTPHLCEVVDMADKLLGVRGGEPMSKNWAERLLKRSDELKLALIRAKDRQRLIQEDPEVIGAWLKLVADTKAEVRRLRRGYAQL